MVAPMVSKMAQGAMRPLSEALHDPIIQTTPAINASVDSRICPLNRLAVLSTVRT